MNTLITCDKPFFTWDEDNGYMRFATQAEALAYANETLGYCRKDAQHDGEWPDAAEDIRVGMVTHLPVASEPDDMGGVDFVLQPLKPAEPKGQTEWDRVYALLRHWSQRAQTAEGALQRLVELHDEPAGFVGKFGKALDEAVEKRATAVEGAIAAARDVLAKVP